MTTWVYHQRTGNLEHAGKLIGTGWSGHDAFPIRGRNNPLEQARRGIGPLPVGTYMIGPAHDDQHLGPCVMALIPDPGNQMFGRSGFFIHGASADHPDMSSDGCVIQIHSVRALLAASAERRLEVVAE